MSRDDVQRWQKHGWISFDVDDKLELDEPDCWEIQFVRDIARSGVSDSQINEFLSSLLPPYRFDPSKVVYSFSFGWVTPQQEDPYAVIEDNIFEWISILGDDGNLSRLRELASKIDEQIEALEESVEDTE